jgi:flavin-binding protein dodecin
LADDPTPEIERSQQSMIVRSLQRMTDSGLGLTENLIADGGHAHYEELADGAEVSASTVYRWLQRMGEAVESDNGVITFTSAQLREQFQEIVGRTATSFVNTVDNAMRRADTVLEQDAYQRHAGDSFESWRQKWGAEILDNGEVLQLGSTLPHPERSLDAPVDAGDVTKDGFDAWRDAGRGPGRFPSDVAWEDEAGHRQREDVNHLLQAANDDVVSEAVQKLAGTFRGKDVVDVVDTVKTMIDAGASWSAEQIQAAVEEAGYDIDVEDTARPDFHIPETNR